jgi:predicted permease
MDDFIFSINAVTPLFILMTAGYIARQINFVSDKFLSEVNRFVFKFLLPLMLFQNIRFIFHGDFSNTSLIFTAMAGVSIVIAGSLCIVPLFVKRRGQCGSMIQGIYRSNFLIYGMPLATGMYGQDAARAVAMLLGVIVPFYNIAAVFILSAFSETRVNRLSLVRLLWDVVRNPLIIGCVVGLLFGMFRIEIPEAVNKPIDELSAAASPLALFLMGGEFKFRSLNNNLWKVLSVTVARLVIVPLAAMLVFIPMGFRTIDMSVMLCLFATPAAVSGYIMANNMGCDGELSGQIVVLTTVGSCLSIFLFVFVLKSIGVL